MYDKLLKRVNEGEAILTARVIHPDIPTIHDVGHKLHTDTPVEHYGSGLFMAKVGDGKISFDGGGAMHREQEVNGVYAFSWTLLRARSAQLDAMGYALDKVRAALVKLEKRRNLRLVIFDGGMGL